MDEMEKILAILKSYICQYSVDEDGNPLSLVDLLSQLETIKEGKKELELLAEHIYCELGLKPHDEGD